MNATVPQDSDPALRHSKGGRGEDDSDGGADGDSGRHHEVRVQKVHLAFRE